MADLGKILIIDEDEAITDLLTLNLCTEGYNVTVMGKTSEVDLRDLHGFNLLLIDCARQEPSGISLIKTIKQSPEGDSLGVIYYSQYDSERTLVDVLNAGADDCICKPFSLREMLARINAVMRRWARSGMTRAAEKRRDIVHIGALCINTSHKTVTIDDEPVNLSNTEFAILELLVRNANTYTSRIEIFRKIWPEGTGANERIVDTNISRMRRKLGDLGSCIANRQGLGYILVTDDKQA